MNEELYQAIKCKRDAIMRLREELAVLERALELLDPIADADGADVSMAAPRSTGEV